MRLPRCTTPVQSFWAKASPEPNSGCWLWLGATNRGGYGVISIGNSKARLAHRFGFELLQGAVPDGLELDHLCRVRSCVNPAHLEPVSRRENTLRGESPSVMVAKMGHCKRGHPFGGDNLYIRKSGKRECRACRNRPMPTPLSQRRCKRGHDLSGRNLYFAPNGKRECRACRALRRK